MRLKDKVIVVTGGGNGIGRELVLELLRRESKVAAIDIDQKGLEQTMELAGNQGKNLSIHRVDLSKKEEVYKLPEEVMKIHNQVDGLINNAGIIQPFIHVNNLEYTKIEQVMNINFYGPLYLIKAFLPELLKRPIAHITNVSSMGGFVPVPGQTIYGASKAALKLLSEGLHSELKDTNVGVTTVFPGGVATNITKNSGAEMKMKDDKKASKMKLLTPQKAAQIIIDATQKEKYKVLAGKDSKFLDFLTRLCPKKAANIIAKKLS
ncbi:MAG: SDR family NAD(P)-dependent oxidoreductase [Bacilli bacterium]